MDPIIASLFPPAVAVAVWPEGDRVPAPDPAELPSVIRAVAKRREEFAKGRACAREALTRLGLSAVPVPVGPHREPLWPDGVTGAITHCEGLVAAAVAPTAVVAGLGLDVERVGRLSPDVRALVCTPQEMEWAAEHAEPERGDWTKLFFSAKESIYKAVFPIFGEYLDFLDVDLIVDAQERRYRARPSRRPGAVFPGLDRVEGRWEITDRFVLTGAVVCP